MNKIILSVLIFLFSMNGFTQEGLKFMEGSFERGEAAKENGFRGCLYLMVRTVSLDERGGVADSGGRQVF